MFVIWPLASRQEREDFIRGSGIKDERIIECALNIPIAEFRPWEFQALPSFAAGVAEALRVKDTDKVLEIGTGTGYLTALLAILSRQVFTFEIRPTLAQFSRANLDATHYGTNVTVICADGSGGYPEENPFDRIFVSGSVPAVPQPLLEQLGDGGTMLIAIQSGEKRELQLITRNGASFNQEAVGSAGMDPLLGKYGSPLTPGTTALNGRCHTFGCNPTAGACSRAGRKYRRWSRHLLRRTSRLTQD
jgi:protein-L-isoaspartate(D-aspartate) O-methyltransferase